MYLRVFFCNIEGREKLRWAAGETLKNSGIRKDVCSYRRQRKADWSVKSFFRISRAEMRRSITLGNLSCRSRSRAANENAFQCACNYLAAKAKRKALIPLGGAKRGCLNKRQPLYNYSKNKLFTALRQNAPWLVLLRPYIQA